MRTLLYLIAALPLILFISCTKPTDPDDIHPEYEIQKSSKSGKAWELKYTLPEQNGTAAVRQTGMATSNEFIYVSTTLGGLYRVNTITSEIKEVNNGIVKITEFGIDNLTVWSVLAIDKRVIAGSGGNYSNCRFFISDNNAESFPKVVSFDSSGFCIAIAVSPNGYIFAGGYKNLYYSKDNGTNWTSLINNIKQVDFGYIRQFKFDKYANIYAATDIGVYYSDSRNINFRLIGLESERILGIDINSQGWIYASAGSGKIYISKNNGSSWEALSNSPGDVCSSLYINKQDHIIAGTMGGLFISDDKGANWTFTGLDDQLIERIIQDKDGNLYAGTYMNRIYKCVN